jgi:hypothetical protein
MKKKNADYGAGDEDPFYNFHADGEYGFIVRLHDKMARLRNFLRKGFFEVASETFRDTIIDGINYLVLLYAYTVRNEESPLLDYLHSSPPKEDVFH